MSFVFNLLLFFFLEAHRVSFTITFFSFPLDVFFHVFDFRSFSLYDQTIPMSFCTCIFSTLFTLSLYFTMHTLPKNHTPVHRTYFYVSSEKPNSQFHNKEQKQALIHYTAVFTYFDKHLFFKVDCML